MFSSIAHIDNPLHRYNILLVCLSVRVKLLLFCFNSSPIANWRSSHQLFIYRKVYVYACPTIIIVLFWWQMFCKYLVQCQSLDPRDPSTDGWWPTHCWRTHNSLWVLPTAKIIPFYHNQIILCKPLDTSLVSLCGTIKSPQNIYTSNKNISKKWTANFRNDNGLKRTGTRWLLFSVNFKTYFSQLPP